MPEQNITITNCFDGGFWKFTDREYLALKFIKASSTIRNKKIFNFAMSFSFEFCLKDFAKFKG